MAALVAIAALAVLNVAVLAVSVRLLVALGAQHDAERQEWTRERQTLLNRIKPETAQYVADDDVPSPPAVTWDDDVDFWHAREDRGDTVLKIRELD